MRLLFTFSVGLVGAALLAGPPIGQGPATQAPASAGVVLPPGEGRDVLVQACNRCHVITAVIGRQRERAEWASVVERMRERGATFSQDEAATIVTYLSTHFSPGSTTPVPPPGFGGGRLFILAGRVPETEPVLGQPLETRDAVGAGQKPAFSGQTRAPAVRTTSPIAATVVAHGLRNPWGLAFLPDGRMLVTEKPGSMRIVTASGAIGEPIGGVPPVVFRVDAGLLDIALDPDFRANRQVFFTFVEPREGGHGTTLARARLSADEKALVALTILLRVEPTGRGLSHFGSRLLFDRESKLLMTVGERADPLLRQQAQQLDSHLGKVLRLNTDGSAAAGSPFAKVPGARPEIWSYGHRNPQGLAFHPVTGALWSTEHGEAGGDEVNVVSPGHNYGWPMIAYGTEYDLRPINGGRTAAAEMEQPVYYWDPAIGPTGMAFYSGTLIPEWRNNLFVAGHATQHVARLVLDGERVVGEERLLLDQHQMMRWVGQGPDGALWVLTDNADGRLIRLARNQ